MRDGETGCLVLASPPNQRAMHLIPVSCHFLSFGCQSRKTNSLLEGKGFMLGKGVTDLLRSTCSRTTACHPLGSRIERFVAYANVGDRVCGEAGDCSTPTTLEARDCASDFWPPEPCPCSSKQDVDVRPGQRASSRMLLSTFAAPFRPIKLKGLSIGITFRDGRNRQASCVQAAQTDPLVSARVCFLYISC